MKGSFIAIVLLLSTLTISHCTLRTSSKTHLRLEVENALRDLDSLRFELINRVYLKGENFENIPSDPSHRFTFNYKGVVTQSSWHYVLFGTDNFWIRMRSDSSEFRGIWSAFDGYGVGQGYVSVFKNYHIRYNDYGYSLTYQITPTTVQVSTLTKFPGVSDYVLVSTRNADYAEMLNVIQKVRKTIVLKIQTI